MPAPQGKVGLVGAGSAGVGVLVGAGRLARVGAAGSRQGVRQRPAGGNKAAFPHPAALPPYVNPQG